MNSDMLKTTVANFFLKRLKLLNTVKFVGFVNVVFSIPINSYHFFFTITEGDAQPIAQDFSAIQQYCENVSEICIDHSVPTENVYLLENGYVGYVFISADQFHECLGQLLESNGSVYKGIGVMPVNTVELQIKRAHGIDALFDYWNKTGKDRVAFNKK